MANEYFDGMTSGGTTYEVVDPGARQLIASLQTALNSLTSGDTTTAIESFNEIIAFLENVSDGSTLQGIIAGLNTTIAAKYSKPSTGIPATDLAQAVQTILNSVANKANSTDVYTKSEVDDAVAEASSGAVSVTTNQDGTFTIHVGDTDYTINLNHTHQNMCKLEIVDEEPSNPATDTIYALVDDASDPTEIESLWIAGLEFVGGGGGEPDDGLPKMAKPTDGSTISLGNNTSGLGVSKVITIKAKNLDYGGSTTGLTVEVVGTGLTIDYGQQTGQSSISIAQADAHIGTSITVSYGSNNGLDDGELLFKQGNNILAEVTLTVEVNLPSGFVADKAWEDTSPRTLKDKTGYCVSNKLQITNGHDLEICFGFINADGEKYGCATFTTEPSSLSTDEAVAVYTANNNIRTFKCNFRWISCTFKASEINNCYIKDASSDTYIWKGNNVT